MKITDFVEEVNGVKTINKEALVRTLTELNCSTVEKIMMLLNDSDFLIDIAMSYAITFCMLEETFEFNMLACVNEMYMRAKHPEMLKELDAILKEERDEDFERSWGPQDDDEDDDDTNVQ